MGTKDEIQAEIDRLEKEISQEEYAQERWQILNARIWALKWVLKAEG